MTSHALWLDSKAKMVSTDAICNEGINAGRFQALSKGMTRVRWTEMSPLFYALACSPVMCSGITKLVYLIEQALRVQVQSASASSPCTKTCMKSDPN